MKKITFNALLNHKAHNYKPMQIEVYMSEDAWLDELYIIQLRSKEAVFSHETALYLHGLMEREPNCTTLTVNRTYNATHLRKRGYKIYTASAELLDLGRTTIETNYDNQVMVYDMARTLCDIIRCRNKMDVQVFQTAMKEYMRSSSKNLTNLMQYAKILGIEETVKMYVEVML